MSNKAYHDRYVDGRKVHTARVHKEGEYYLWRIVDKHGTVYTDGGNFRTRKEATESLLRRFDPS